MADKEQYKRSVEAYRAGKSWRSSALENGLSIAVASLGAAGARKQIKAIDEAFIELAQQAAMRPNELKALSMQRLVNDIERGKSSGVSREIEVLGRFKEHDWWVRNVDIQVGIFAGLGSDVADPASDAIKLYPEE